MNFESELIDHEVEPQLQRKFEKRGISHGV